MEPNTVRAAASERITGGTLAKIGAGFAVALVLLYLFGWTIGWPEIARTFQGANYWWLVLALASTVVGMVAWAKAWEVLLAVVAVDIPFPSVFEVFLAGVFVDHVTPLGNVGGGPIVAYVLSIDERATYPQSLASVTTADLLNFLPFFGFAVVGLFGISLGGDVPQRGELLIVGLLAISVFTTAAAVLVLRYRRRVENALVRGLTPIAKWLPILQPETVRAEIRGFYEVVDAFGDDPTALAYSLLLSIAGWLFFAGSLLFAGLTLGVTIDPLVVLFVVPASSLAGFIPTPGGLGGIEFALTGLLVALVPISAGVAAAITIVYRVATYWFVVLIGAAAALHVIYATGR